MVEVGRKIYEYYKFLVDDLADRRTDDYILVASPWRPIGILLLYVLIVKKILPAIMRNRQPMKLDNIVLFYNFTQIVLNAYLLCRIISLVKDMNPMCAPVDYSDSPNSRLQLDVCNWYYLLKIYDLLDTAFFILRKKEKQVTHLHMYHHALMVTFPWIGLRYVAGGHSLYLGFFNTFVHIAMYFYYGYTLWNSGAKRNVWWKKHLTQLQLLQFFLMFTMGVILLVQPTCTFPKFVIYLGIPHNLYLMHLFGNFYYNTYIVNSGESKVRVKKND